jgi:hypothetical protein
LEPLLSIVGGDLTLDSTVMVETENVSLLNNDAGYGKLGTAETLTADWDNTANPWAANEITEADPIYSVDPASGITGGDITNWDTAYGWGNHATAGYLTSYTETDPVVANIGNGIVTSDGAGTIGFITDNSANWNTAFGWGNHATAGYLTSETDPVVANIGNGIVTSNGAGIIGFITDNSSNWDTAYGWGDHSTAGYLTSESDSVFTGSFTASGDILYGTGVGTYTQLGIGSNGDVLTIAGGVPTWSTTAETDPIVGAVSGIVVADGAGNISAITDNSANWDTAYGWGDHSAAGYLTADGNTDLTGNWTITGDNVTLSGGTLQATSVTDGTATMTGGDLWADNLYLTVQTSPPCTAGVDCMDGQIYNDSDGANGAVPCIYRAGATNNWVNIINGNSPDGCA